jgi:hypothetical protein
MLPSTKLVGSSLEMRWDRASPDAERFGDLQDTPTLRKLLSHLPFGSGVLSSAARGFTRWRRPPGNDVTYRFRLIVEASPACDRASVSSTGHEQKHISVSRIRDESNNLKHVSGSSLATFA